MEAGVEGSLAGRVGPLLGWMCHQRPQPHEQVGAQLPTEQTAVLSHHRCASFFPSGTHLFYLSHLTEFLD